MAQKNSYKRVKSVKKAMEILNFLSDQVEPVTSGDISRALGLPPETVYSLVYTMADAGYIEARAEGFELGIQVAKLWYQYRANIQKVMTALSKRYQDLEL